MRLLASVTLVLFTLATAACDNHAPADGLPLEALAGPWNGTLLQSETLAGVFCNGEPVSGVALAFELGTEAETPTDAPSGSGSLQFQTSGEECALVEASLTEVDYDPPHLRLAFGEHFVLAGEVTERQEFAGLLLEGALELRGAKTISFSVARGPSLFVIGSPFGGFRD